ncbi:MAG: sugar phosphate isomerase/epimerase [Spirochaetaceae bacterium]|nr:sugar phosphate isomerase/epimerase [Spirochaetaceae bacterium]
MSHIFYSELCLIGGDVSRNVDRLVDAGADGVELMIDGAGWNGVYDRPADYARALAGKGVEYSVHVPVWDANLTSENPRIREATAATYRFSIEFAATIGARHVVLHPGCVSDPRFSRHAAMERARDAVAALVAFNEAYGRSLLVENIGSRDSCIFTESQFAAFLDGFPPEVGYVVDVGHANVCGWRLESLLPALGARLRAMHLHDNDGGSDAHAPLGRGTVDWPAVMAAAARGGADPALVLEYDIGTDLRRLAEGKAFLSGITSTQGGEDDEDY